MQQASAYKTTIGSAGEVAPSSNDTSYLVYNQGYGGKTYSVKYLGIVDGTMGILSRKMALVGAADAAVPITPSIHNNS